MLFPNSQAWVEANAYPILDGGLAVYFHDITDITEHKVKEEELYRINRTMRAISNSNQALMHATDEALFLQEVCRIITEDCGHAMVWIGYAEDNEKKSVRPVAYSGFEEGYLETLQITWADMDRGRGPTGLAIRSCQPCFCRNMLTDPAFLPWREQAVKRGYASSVVLPLLSGDKAFGALTIYSREPDPFSEDEVRLLNELASDLAYGIETLRLRTARMQAEEALRESRAKLEAALASMTDAVFISDVEGRFINFNDAFATFHKFKNKEECSQIFADYPDILDVFFPDGRLAPPDKWAVPRALRGETAVNAEYTLRRKDTGEIWVGSYSFAPIRDPYKKIIGSVVVGRDITERKQTEEALRQSHEELEYRVLERTAELQRSYGQLKAEIEERRRIEEALRESEQHFRILAETLPQLVWMRDAEGNQRYANSRYLDYTGLAAEELMENSWLNLIHPKDKLQVITNWNKSIQTGLPFEAEYRIRRHDGEYRWFLVRGLPLYDQDGKIIRWFGTSTDIQYQKQLEEKLQDSNFRLRQLSNKVVSNLEEERSSISRELHDEAGQALTALKMYIELIMKGLPVEAAGVQQRLAEAVNLTDQTLKNIRRLAQDLRPPGLDALGLNFTLEDFCYEFGKRVGLDIKYQGCELPALTGMASISLYRFLQEALTNVVKHAKAGSVYVQLGYSCQQITLEVKDDGIGFELTNEVIKRKSMGLVGMQERLAMLGGTLTIDSKIGLGTSLVATIPWEAIE
jgi:PAS domain S-box-containing protein